MAKTKEQKQVHVDALVADLKESKSAVIANFQGLTVQATEELRAKCRENNIKFIATKKTLLKRALSALDLDVDTKSFEGGVSVAFGLTDEVAPAKVIADFAKDNEIVTMFGGVLEGSYIDNAKVAELSKLPSKEELYARLVGSINAPVSGFVNVLAGNIRGLANVLNAIKDNKTA